MSPTGANATWRRAVVAEIAWVGDDGPAAAAIVPLELDGRPCAAVPYHRLDEVASLVDGARTTWTVTDPRGRDDEPGARFAGTVRVRDDLEGREFRDRLLDQELHKHPPTRLRADSPLRRREQWWWLPRRLIVLDGPSRAGAVARRERDEDGVLVTAAPDGEVAVTAVTATAAVDGRLTVAARDGRPVRGAAEPALLFGHDYAIPDLSRWTSWRRHGELRGDELHVTATTGTPGVAATPARLRDRLRDELAVGRGCRRGVRRVAADRHPT